MQYSTSVLARIWGSVNGRRVAGIASTLSQSGELKGGGDKITMTKRDGFRVGYASLIQSAREPASQTQQSKGRGREGGGGGRLIMSALP